MSSSPLGGTVGIFPGTPIGRIGIIGRPEPGSVEITPHTPAASRSGINLIGADSALSTTITIPTHDVGDMLLMFAYRTGVTTPPTLPDGWKNLDSGGSGLNGSRVAYKIAASDSETSGTWTNASGLIIHVYRTDGRWKAPEAESDGNYWASSTMKFPDMPARPGGARFVRFAGQRTATDMLGSTPSGWIPIAGQSTRIRSMDSGKVVKTTAHGVGGDTQTVNTASSWRTVTVSLSDAIPPTGALLDVWNKIPASGTVFTLSGLNFNIYNDMPEKFQGMFSEAPYAMEQIKYPASLANDSISRGVQMLDDALLGSSGDVIVLAQSQGAQVCSHWMRQYAGDSTREALASRVVFLLTGNPVRATGGELIGGPEVGGTIGEPTPTDTVWPIVDVARRYDGWPDPPTDLTNVTAVDNAKAGKKSFHTAYDEVNLFDPTHTVWTEGNTTFVLTAETPPIFAKYSFPDSVDDWIKQKVEEAYDNRPAEDSVEPASPPDMFWRFILNFLGIDI